MIKVIVNDNANKFENEINLLLKKGYNIKDISCGIEKQYIQDDYSNIIYTAILSKKENFLKKLFTKK